MRKLLFVLLFVPCIVFAQEKKEAPKYGIAFSGFVKSDVFFDSRQTINIREGHFLVFPANEMLDSSGKDINAVPNFNMLSIQSRLTGKISAPDAFGAKTEGVLEADFFGNEFVDAALKGNFVDGNGFRLRHSFVKLTWPQKNELLIGQFWHPLFNHNSFPGTVSFNTGVPFQPFSRNPQVRYTHKIGDISTMACILSQRDFVSVGGSTPLRNSAIPEVQAQISYGTKNDSLKTELLVGIGGGYKILRPRLYTTTTIGVTAYNHKTDETVGSFSANIFVKYKIEPITIKFQGVYGQNLQDLVMLGSYGVSDTTDKYHGFKEYTPVNTMSAWLDVNSNGKTFQVGLFGGYTQNLGTSKEINVKDGYSASRGWNIKSVYRVAPRAVFIREKLEFATEIEFTSA
ncbi:MAG: hypothetical protein A3J88_01990, partial [Melioribacter sp. RIFOXYB12_FULL_38_5]